MTNTKFLRNTKFLHISYMKNNRFGYESYTFVTCSTHSYFSSPYSTPFNKQLDVKFKFDKSNRILSVSFSLYNLYDFKLKKNTAYIKNLILCTLSSYSMYTTYIKVKYSNYLFMMAENQFAFN